MLSGEKAWHPEEYGHSDQQPRPGRGAVCADDRQPVADRSLTRLIRIHGRRRYEYIDGPPKEGNQQKAGPASQRNVLLRKDLQLRVVE